MMKLQNNGIYLPAKHALRPQFYTANDLVPFFSGRSPITLGATKGATLCG